MSFGAEHRNHTPVQHPKCRYFAELSVGATRMVAQLRPTGRSEQCLIDVPDWDFNWQLDYMFKAGIPYTESDAVHVPANTGGRIPPPLRPRASSAIGIGAGP